MGQDETKKLGFRASLLTGASIFMRFGAGNLIPPSLRDYKAGVVIVPAFIGCGVSGVALPIMALSVFILVFFAVACPRHRFQQAGGFPGQGDRPHPVGADLPCRRCRPAAPGRRRWGPVEPYAISPLLNGFIKGYRTMDVLADIAFGYVVSWNVAHEGLSDKRDIARQVGKSSVFAGLIMLAIYAGFAYLGVSFSQTPGFTNGAQIIVASATALFSQAGPALVALAFLVACLNVCITLISACASYFSQVYPKFTYVQWAALFTVVSAIPANVGLDAIPAYSVPMPSVIHSMALCLVVYGLLPDNPRHVGARRIAMGACTVLSCIRAVRSGFFPKVTLPVLDWLPLASLDLGPGPAGSDFLVGQRRRDPASPFQEAEPGIR